MKFYELQNLTFRFPNHSSFLLDTLSLSIRSGELVGFLGPNGAGKSTLLKLMAGLLKPTSGEILLEGKKLSSYGAAARAKRVAYVAQATHFAFPLTVWEVVEMGRNPYLGRFQTFGAEDRDVCERALKLCDILDFKDRFYDELSGGEKQRVLLASALAQTPQALLLDEPTVSLDLAHQLALFEIIQRLHKSEGITVIVATHELNLASRYLKRILLMKKGLVVEDGLPSKILTPANIHSVLDISVDRVKSKGLQNYFVPRLPKEVKK